VTVEAEPFLGRNMRPLGFGIDLSVMAGVTEVGRVALEQRPARPGVTAMAGQTLPFARRRVHALQRVRLLPLIMAVQADLGRCFGQHALIVAGMLCVTGPAVPFLDRLVLRRCGNVIMTGQAQPSIEGLKSYGGALDFMAVVAAAALQWFVDDFLEQSRPAGAVLRVTVDTNAFDRIVLVGRSELGAARVMTGGAQCIPFHLQQFWMILHVGIMTGHATVLEGGVDIGPGKRLAVMAIETDFFRRGDEKLGIIGVVRIMAGFAVTVAHRIVHRSFGRDFLERRVALQADHRHRLAHQDRGNQAMGEMTRLAVLFLDRRVNIPGLIAGDLVRMALRAGPADFRSAFLRGGPATRREGQNAQADEGEPPKGSHRSCFHHAPPSSF